MLMFLGIIFLYLILGFFLFYKKFLKFFIKAHNDFVKKHKDINEKKFIKRIELSICYENNDKISRISFDLNDAISTIIFWPFVLFGL